MVPYVKRTLAQQNRLEQARKRQSLLDFELALDQCTLNEKGEKYSTPVATYRPVKEDNARTLKQRSPMVGSNRSRLPLEGRYLSAPTRGERLAIEGGREGTYRVENVVPSSSYVILGESGDDYATPYYVIGHDYVTEPLTGSRPRTRSRAVSAKRTTKPNRKTKVNRAASNNRKRKPAPKRKPAQKRSNTRTRRATSVKVKVTSKRSTSTVKNVRKSGKVAAPKRAALKLTNRKQQQRKKTAVTRANKKNNVLAISITSKSISKTTRKIRTNKKNVRTLKRTSTRSRSPE